MWGAAGGANVGSSRLATEVEVTERIRLFIVRSSKCPTRTRLDPFFLCLRSICFADYSLLFNSLGAFFFLGNLIIHLIILEKLRNLIGAPGPRGVTGHVATTRGIL